MSWPWARAYEEIYVGHGDELRGLEKGHDRRGQGGGPALEYPEVRPGARIACGWEAGGEAGGGAEGQA